ncbi:MAG TPA: hypothetical protein EYQ53_03615 [Candidatus Poseidoniales archaeon]|nr:hypothetical protein [Candidatus Poseidoniales archaeon]
MKIRKPPPTIVEEPTGWPGRLWVEGRTLTHVSDVEGQAELKRGPGSKTDLEVFHNPAMSGNRTRSVLLLEQCLREDWLTKEGAPLRILDGLAASAIRSRRWLNELPVECSSRLLTTICDINPTSLSWARKNHQTYPQGAIENAAWNVEEGYENGLKFVNGDLRKRVLEHGWQWIDLDPFGSPVPFVDAVIQGLSRRAVLEVTATDTAALCGSAASSSRRRYGVRAVVDDLRHDTAIRVLIGHIASIAAKHDRIIEPLMSVFDDHHVRISLLVTKSKEKASDVFSTIGWRIHKPTEEEVQISMLAGLHPAGSDGSPQISALVPYDNQPFGLIKGRVSGPLWTGPIGKGEVLANMTEVRAQEYCALSKIDDSETISILEKVKQNSGSSDEKIVEKILQTSSRQAIRAVAGLAEVSSVIHLPNTYPVDMLPSIIGNIAGPPSPSKLAKMLRDDGWLAERDILMVPAVRTNAPWSVIVEAIKSLSPKFSDCEE